VGVLRINSFYYPDGGDCTHMSALGKALSGCGHEVAVLSMRHPEDLPSPWAVTSLEVAKTLIVGAVLRLEPGRSIPAVKPDRG